MKSNTSANSKPTGTSRQDTLFTSESPAGPLPLLQLRVVSFYVAAAIFASAIYAGFLAPTFILAVLLCLVFPWFSHWWVERIKKSYNVKLTAVILVSESFLFGVAITIMQFTIAPTLAFAIMASVTVMTVVGIKGWASSIITMILSSTFTAFLLNQTESGSAPFIVSAVTTVGMFFYTTLTAFYTNKQTIMLYMIQNELIDSQMKTAVFTQKLVKYIPAQVWSSLFKGEKEARLETNRKKLTVFFSDIKGFADISEQMQPEALTDILNTYFTEMSAIASEFGGTIDKFMGDGIMIFFGDPTTEGEAADALACAHMAIEMKKRMKTLSHKWQAQGISKKLQIRMGINTGYCTVGNFGTEDRMDYTIIGKEVNLASRLEALAEPNEIFIAPSTHSLIQDTIMCRDRGRVTIRGFTKPVPVYEILGLRKDLGGKPSYVEHELNGFALFMNIDAISRDQKAEVETALQQAINEIKSS